MNNGRTLALVAVLLVGACHGDSNPAQPPKPRAHAKTPVAASHGPTPEEMTAGMVEAVTVGKSAVPVGVKFDLPSRPSVGQPLDIVIAVMPLVAGSATIRVKGSDGLQLAPGADLIDIPSVEPTQAYRMTIGATPTADGLQLLELAVSLVHDQTTEVRSFSVPVIVAAPVKSASLGKP